MDGNDCVGVPVAGHRGNHGTPNWFSGERDKAIVDSVLRQRFAERGIDFRSFGKGNASV